MLSVLHFEPDGTVECTYEGDGVFKHCQVKRLGWADLHRPSWVDDSEWEQIKASIHGRGNG